MIRHLRIPACVVLVVLCTMPACDTTPPVEVAGFPPVIEEFRPADSLLALDIGQTLRFSVDASDPDGDRLTHTYSMDGSVVSRGRDWQYTVDDTGSAVISCVVSDGEFDTRVDWNVTRRMINRPPTIVSFAPVADVIEVDLGASLDFSVAAVDPDGDQLTHYFRIDGALSSTESDVSFLAQRPGRFAVEAFVWDGKLVASHRWVVNVIGPEINHPPVIYFRVPVGDNQTVRLGNDLEFRIQASDPDGDDVDYSFTIDGVEVSTSESYVHHATEGGTFVIRGTASDSEFSESTTWTLRVEDNHDPVIVNWSPTSTTPNVTVGTNVVFGVNVADADGDALTYTWYLNGRIVGGNGPIWVYTTNTRGVFPVRVEVSDGIATALRAWSLTVRDDVVNHPPAFTDYQPSEYELVGFVGNEVEFSVEAYDPDGDDIEITFTVDGTVAASGPLLRYSGPEGNHDVEVTVTDGELSASLSWVLTLVDPTESLRGRLRDAVTGFAIADVAATIGSVTVTSNSLGDFTFPGPPPSGGTLQIRDESVNDVFGQYFDYVAPYSLGDGTFLDIVLLPNIPVASSYYTDFHQFYRVMTDVHGIPPSTAQRRWSLPVDIYIPPKSTDGLDYRETIIAILPEFDAILGRPVFRVVDAPPAAGVTVLFPGNLYADNYRVVEWSEDYYPVRGEVKFRSHYTPSTVAAFRTIIRHELGHSLGLNHSADRFHLMVGGQTPGVTEFSEEERNVLKAFYRIQRGFEMLHYVRD